METGTIAQKVHTGRPKTRGEHVEHIYEAFLQSLEKSVYTAKHGLPHKYTKSQRAKVEIY